MSERFDTSDAHWPARPWIMAGICAAAGLTFDALADTNSSHSVSALRQAGASFVAVAALSFVMTVEQRRWLWSLAFALGWGTVIALVGWFTASYNQQGEIAEWPFLSGLFAVLLAAPLFQTVRDEGAWRFPYARLHSHAWTDAVIGAASLAFVGVTFLLSWLIAGMFDLIGIDLVKDLLQESWFAWMLAGFAFGAAVGLLRERDGLVATLQRLVMVVLAVLAPVLAAALLLFLASLPFTGLGGLWDSALPATGLMLLAGAGAVLLANAVIGNGEDDRASGRVLRLSALLLVLTVLPLAIIAAVSIGARIGQYGWTPERIWGVVAVAVAVLYGLAGWWAVAKRRTNFDDLLRPLQTRLALGLCGLALFLALPIVDFGAISANSQMARFASGRVPANGFDWKAMAFDFGPAGRARLAEIARSGPSEQRRLAATALSSRNRYDVEQEVAAADSGASLDRRLRVLPGGAALPQGLREEVAATRHCRLGDCAVVLVDESRAVVAGKLHEGDRLHATVLRLQPSGSWSAVPPPQVAPPATSAPDLRTAPVEVRTVERRQLHIDGTPVGEPFE
ncbi:MAG: DUF4153 domain-containing protein [Pseudomonadota bacterium]|nr:DUF4153 domain-containing protein [Pseudomonadota bacterium]